MGLRDRLSRRPGEGAGEPEPSTGPGEMNGEERRPSTYQTIKFTLHRRLLDEIDMAQILAMDSPATRRQMRELLQELVKRENPPLNEDERKRLVEDLEYETFGLGPIEPLLRDPQISDILVNRADEVYVERSGVLERTEVTFRDDAHLLHVIERIVSRVGRRIDESSPMVDARLPDGSRINAIIPPLAVDGPVLSIRRTKSKPLAFEDLLRNGSVNTTVITLLEAAVRAKLNIIISGGSGSGKTTLLNAMVRFINRHERIVSIEDTVELRLQGQHVVRLETRPHNIEGEGEVTQRDLVKNALRMRPDRIIIGECRGDEAFDMLQAMNTGHRGSLTTIHANTARDAISRLETMILMAGLNLTSDAMRRQISSAIDLVVQVHRFPDGVRRLVSVTEINGMEGSIIKMQEIVRFQQRNSSSPTVVQGDFVCTGVIPRFLEELQRTGVGNINASLFQPAS